MKYQLTIYTWPPLMGAPVGMRWSIHSSPSEARAHLTEQTEPYAYAILSRSIYGCGWNPCGWDGQLLCDDEPWARVYGENKQHPASAALRADEQYLHDEIERRFREHPELGTGAITAELLAQRHPNILGDPLRLAHRRGYRRNHGVLQV